MDSNEKMEKASAVQAQYAEELMAKPHVVGIGIGLMKRDGVYTQDVGLVVMVDQMPPEDQAEADRIPTELDGIPVDIQVTGNFTAQ